MNIDFTAKIDSELLKRFNMALLLNNEESENVICEFMKNYIVKTFSQEAASFAINDDLQKETTKANDENFGKALNRIPKWAKNHNQINHKIIRAYLQLTEMHDMVTYNMLFARCSDAVNHADVYVPTFTQNFSQMKIDNGNSHGKVFEVNNDNIVTIWEHVAYRINEFKKDFLYHYTDVGYKNKNGQINMGRNGKPGNDNFQYYYNMKCEYCGEIHESNGTNIYEKKCPNPECPSNRLKK